MSYQALYRVWRPRTFADVVGQSHITTTLQNAISQNKFSHAYLFSGPRGTGKTSAAKIFAQTINCEKMPQREPCNECSACLGILDGSISDVIEIDAASNTSVDDIRDIRDKVKYAPTSVPYKVYIIDEVHMISVNAFNALLKTLEEPPAHVVFILATTEPHKIPLTIISRCQRFDFKSITNQVIFDRMRVITDHDKVTISSEALEAIALTASGGMRDALSILDQAISYSNGEIDTEDVLAVTGGVSQSVLTDITRLMYAQDIKETLQLFDAVIQNGKDPGRFVFDFIYFLRDILFYKTTSALAEYLERAIVTDDFKQIAEEIEFDWIQEAIVRFTECEQQIKWTNSPKIFVEVTIIMVTNRHYEVKSAPAVPVEEMTQLTSRITQLEKQLTTMKESPAAERPTPQRREPSKGGKRQFTIPYERIRAVLNSAEKAPLQNVHSKWAAFLENLKTVNAPAHAIVKDSRPAAASSEALVIAFKYEIHCSLLLENKELIESMLAQEIDTTLSVIPIPEDAWLELREEYVSRQKATNAEKETESTTTIVDAAKELVGDDLVEVHD